MPPRSTPADPARERAIGAIYAAVAYLIWGFFPAYFLSIAPTGPWEMVAWRVLLSLAFCAILLTVVRGGWARLIAICRSARLVGWMGVAGALIMVNWTTYLVASLSGHIIEASLGYFINPLVTVLLGVIVLRERLRPWQWVATGIVAVAVVVIAIGYGAVPWLAFVLAFSFGTYGLVKKHLGPRVDAISGLTLEAAWIAPLAVVLLIVVASTTGLTLGTEGALHAALLLCAGVVTATPLLFFAAGARRAKLSTLGLLQFITPIMLFATGVWLGEPMPIERWIGFALVWLALIVLSVDQVVQPRRRPAPDVVDVGPVA